MGAVGAGKSALSVEQIDDTLRQNQTALQACYEGALARNASLAGQVVVHLRVSGEGHVVCGRCRNCMAGRRHLCAHTSGVGVNRAGCFAEFIALPMANIWKHDPKVDRDCAAIFDPFGNAVHTALTFDVVGEDVLITGAGPIGIMAAAVVGMRERGVNPLQTGLGMTFLINIVFTLAIPGISVGGHFGGALAGAICGAVVLAPARWRVPRFAHVVVPVVVGACCVLIAVTPSL